MDQIKIGRFIAERRKANHLTQMQLAEKLGISDRAVSKWENGRSMPDSSIMPELCRLLGITVNDLFNGEVVVMENYNEKTEQLLIEIAREKEEADKRLLTMEIVIGVVSTVFLLAMLAVGAVFMLRYVCISPSGSNRSPGIMNVKNAVINISRNTGASRWRCTSAERAI